MSSGLAPFVRACRRYAAIVSLYFYFYFFFITIFLGEWVGRTGRPGGIRHVRKIFALSGGGGGGDRRDARTNLRVCRRDATTTTTTFFSICLFIYSFVCYFFFLFPVNNNNTSTTRDARAPRAPARRVQMAPEEDIFTHTLARAHTHFIIIQKIKITQK